MTTPPTAWRLRPQGDRCLCVDLAVQGAFDVELGLRCLALAQALREADLPGVTDIVGSFTSVALHFAHGSGSESQVAERLQRLAPIIEAGLAAPPPTGREVEIPVCYGGPHGPDLESLASARGLAQDELVARHLASACHVITLGFAPGFAYIGLLDEAFDVPRRTVPRTHVPAGSVAIANRQAAIYPNDSPGGWHLIGQTPLVLFDPGREPPALLGPGDRVRFTALSPEAFEAAKALGHMGKAAGDRDRPGGRTAR